MSAGSVRALLSRYGLAPNRELGQNFLVDETIAERLVTRAGVGFGDAVVEIGTGLGVMTRALARRAARVVTIEVDAGLVRLLEAEGALAGNVSLVHADVLDVDLAALVAPLGPSVRVIGNLPYAISSPILRRLLDLRRELRGWSVMLQRELAMRLVAEPETRDYGSLAVLHALCTRVERTMDLAPGCFFPAPNVRSTFLNLAPLTAAKSPEAAELARIERVVRAAFGTRRKTLANALRAGLGDAADARKIGDALAKVGLDPGVRAERVAPEAFRALTHALEESCALESDA